MRVPRHLRLDNNKKKIKKKEPQKHNRKHPQQLPLRSSTTDDQPRT